MVFRIVRTHKFKLLSQNFKKFSKLKFWEFFAQIRRRTAMGTFAHVLSSFIISRIRKKSRRLGSYNSAESIRTVVVEQTYIHPGQSTCVTTTASSLLNSQKKLG